jgi:hypothetical protein
MEYKNPLPSNPLVSNKPFLSRLASTEGLTKRLHCWFRWKSGQGEGLLLAVTSTDRRNTIILTRIDGVIADEKKVHSSWVYGGTEDGAVGPLAKG